MLIFSRYTWWVASMIGFAFLLAIMGQTGLLRPFQGLFSVVTTPIDNVLSGAFEPVASFLSNAGNVNSLRDENARLRIENEALNNKVTQLQQDAQTVNDLQQALKIVQSSTSETRIAASVVVIDNTPFTDVVGINRGSSSGIKVGMVVLSAQGTLMGTVISVNSDSAFVRKITDSKSKVNAHDLESKSDGIVQGTPNRGLTFNLSQADIKVGDTIVTSGLGGNYPPGIPIGKVTAVSGTSQDLFRQVTVEPGVRLSTTTTVLVNTSFVPQRISVGTP